MKFVPDTSAAASGWLGSMQLPNTYPMPLAGTYPQGTAGVNTFSWTYSGSQANWENYKYIPGSLGPYTYYPYANGPFTADTTLTMDSGVLMARFASQTTANNAFLTARGTYDTAKNVFNRALKLEK